MAQVPNYGPGWVQRLNQQLARISRAEAAPGNLCPALRAAADRGVLDVRYALGYFDESTANQFALTDPAFNLSYSLDILAFGVIREVLTGPCASPEQNLCAFRESGNADTAAVVLERDIPLGGKPVKVRLRLTQSSASERYRDNQGPLRERQQATSSQSRENFLAGLREADVILYNGHSRNGGGPDFRPPVLRESDLHVNYARYMSAKIEMRDMLAAMSEAGGRPRVVGIFSCFSRKHFQAGMSRANPAATLILSEDEIPYDTALVASLSYLEALLRGNCGAALADKAAAGDPRIRAGYKAH